MAMQQHAVQRKQRHQQHQQHQQLQEQMELLDQRLKQQLQQQRQEQRALCVDTAVQARTRAEDRWMQYGARFQAEHRVEAARMGLAAHRRARSTSALLSPSALASLRAAKDPLPPLDRAVSATPQHQPPSATPATETARAAGLSTSLRGPVPKQRSRRRLSAFLPRVPSGPRFSTGRSCSASTGALRRATWSGPDTREVDLQTLEAKRLSVVDKQGALLRRVRCGFAALGIAPSVTGRAEPFVPSFNCAVPP